MDLGTDSGTLGGTHFGRMAATLSEAVIMLIAMTVAARWVIRRFEVPQTLSDTLSIGLIAIWIAVTG